MSLTIKFTCDKHPEACGEEFKKTKKTVNVKGVGFFCKKCYKKINPQPVVESESESESEEEEEEEKEKGGGWETQEARRKRRNADFEKSFTEFLEKHHLTHDGDGMEMDTIFQDLEKMVKQKTNPNNKRGLKRMGETHKTKPRKAGKVAVEDCYVMSARDETLLEARGFYLHEKTNIYQRDSWGIDPKTRERGAKPSIKRECYNTLTDAFKRMDEIKKMWDAGELNKKHYGNPDDWSVHYGRKRGGRFELRKTCECKNSPPSKMNLMTRVFLPIGRTPEMKEDSWKKDNTQKKSAEVVVESEEEEEMTLPTTAEVMASGAKKKLPTEEELRWID